ncbi:Sphingoid long-chain base transporter RSB1 [Lachnellula suecica]|uniref:Sphingoid long-chain base transporter RSB1 n=1 Tax=Lachnellula suecica TaxID=602035 RepID=A0A8T9C5Y3_9HELO|nr:Sphingoid long-chain base transporter RSB1 [Lachnellula suecica]
MPDYSTCTSVTPQCPVSATTYGYYPNLPGNIILSVVFGLCTIAQLGLSIKGRTWTWLAGLLIGCGLEFAGYIGRILMHSNPWSQNAFRLQIITLILGPSFIAAGVDLTLKHLVIHFGKQYSLIKPALYTWLFIGFDIFSILLQAAGGGIAAAGETNVDLLNTGDHLIVAGIALQVAQLVAFGVVSVYYGFNVYRHQKAGPARVSKVSGGLIYFMSMVAVAYVCILIRCVYRIPEMAGGWGSGLQRDETLFLVLDGAVVAIAAIALTLAHPAIFFPVMGNGQSHSQSNVEIKSERENGMTEESDTH